MFKVVWRYQVKPEKKEDFLKMYDSQGEWVDLFSNSNDFIKTELFRESNDTCCFVTIDYWKSKQAYEAFYRTERKEVNRLDSKGDGFTDHEERVGEIVK